MLTVYIRSESVPPIMNMKFLFIFAFTCYLLILALLTFCSLYPQADNFCLCTLVFNWRYLKGTDHDFIFQISLFSTFADIFAV